MNRTKLINASAQKTLAKRFLVLVMVKVNPPKDMVTGRNSG